MKELNPELFTYELWESSYWTRLGFSYDADAFQVARKASECAVGYCDASRLQVRPREGMIAVMCEDSDGEKFWFHDRKSCYSLEEVPGGK